jgi:hypothetical protein
MAYRYQPPKFWTCSCDRTTGGHIIAGHYSACVYCSKTRAQLKEIVVPSGLGGMFSVEILEVGDARAKVQVVSNANGFDQLPPFDVALKDIAPRWKREVTA